VTDGVSYRTKDRTEWNENRRGEIELDALARVYLGDAEITDRDRIAFALRELRKRGYDVEACPVDWTKPMMICLGKEAYWSFGVPLPSERYERFDQIARRSCLMTKGDFEHLLTELYPDEAFFFFDHNDLLERPYEFTFKGDPSLVEAVFQEVGFATQHSLLIPDDGSETHHRLGVAPPPMVLA
jgi:hypothetical protein